MTKVESAIAPAQLEPLGPAPLKILLIVNPRASAVTARARLAVDHALSEHDVTITDTTRRRHATDLARQAADDGCQVVAVLGGDGTVNEVANGLGGTDTPMAALPGGSTNVFARTIGMARRPKRAAEQLAEALSRPCVRSIGLGSVNGREFLFHVGIGFDAAVVERVERRPDLKRRLGQAVFVWASFATIRHYDRKRPRFAVQLPDGESVDGRFAVCLKTNPYTYLGRRPFNLAPDAGLDSPLAVVTLRNLRLGTTLALAGSALATGKRLRRHKNVHYRAGLDTVTLSGYGPVPYQADGEYLGESEEITITHEPNRMRLVVP